MAITRDKEITVGHGSFGVVYKGTLENKTHVAVKILAATSKQGDLEFYNEVIITEPCFSCRLDTCYDNSPILS